MKFLKKFFCVALSTMLVMANIISCNNNSKSESYNSGEKVYRIGTLQLIQHVALDQSYQGFIDYLDDKNLKYEMNYQNASGEQNACTTIANQFMTENLDLIYAIATPAAQSVLAVDDAKIPIVASAVTDPAGSGLCDSNSAPGGPLTAASDLTPIEAQFDLLMELVPNAKNVGVFFCSSEANSRIQADMANTAAKSRGLNPIEYTIANSADIQTVMSSMVGVVDCIYIPTDNTLAAGMETVSTFANDNKIPTIVGEEGMAKAGGYATYGIDYYELGRVAGEMAYDILVKESDPAKMPVRYLDSSKCTRYINENTAKILGLTSK